jgi:hypothetical protein
MVFIEPKKRKCPPHGRYGTDPWNENAKRIGTETSRSKCKQKTSSKATEGNLKEQEQREQTGEMGGGNAAE